MKSVATLDPVEAPKLLEFLKNERIPAVIRTVTQESGLDASEILVEESYYPTACDVAERWLASVVEEEDKRSGNRCPQCRSSHIERIEHEKLKYVMQCKDCGCLITHLSHE
jgi:Zn finger protein HypA/HybF involved in hydrogenase expression